MSTQDLSGEKATFYYFTEHSFSHDYITSKVICCQSQEQNYIKLHRLILKWIETEVAAVHSHWSLPQFSQGKNFVVYMKEGRKEQGKWHL